MGKNLKCFIETIDRFDNVVIYGAGNNAAPLINYFYENELVKKDKLHIAVTKPKKNESFKEHIVECIDDLGYLRETALVIIAVYKDYYEDIENKLSSLQFQHVMRLEEWFVKEAFYERFEDEEICTNKILFENFHGLGYGDSPKYICNELLDNDKNLDLVWVVKYGINADLPKGVRSVEIYTSDFYYELYTSRIWISNVRKYQSVFKRKGQFYIQTWHGFALKRIEEDAEKISRGISAPYFDAGKKDSQMIDVIISNARAMTDIYRNGFWYNGEVKELGTPRNDIFFRDNVKLNKKLREKYGIQSEKKLVLYAPTFRSSYKSNPLDLDVSRMLNSFLDKSGNEWVCLLRLHPNIVNKKNEFQYNESMISVTDYPDIMELLAVTDVLVTDYSSVMFDFMLTKKPVYLYAKDLDYYKNSDRGFYFDYFELPFPIATSNQEMTDNIKEFDEKIYKDKVDSFISEKGICDDGFAASRVASVIRNELGEF